MLPFIGPELVAHLFNGRPNRENQAKTSPVARAHSDALAKPRSRRECSSTATVDVAIFCRYERKKTQMSTASILSEGQQSSTPRAYKRSPALSNSTWYKGMLHSRMAGTADNNGAFDFVISTIRRGTEPPPHVHSREDEFFYVSSGEMRVYVDGEVFTVKAGECVFLPRLKPHAWVITSEAIRMMTLITPGGFTDALIKMSAPAERMEIPTDADTVTYPNADLTETIKVHEQYGVRLLTLEEIRREMPRYPV